MQKLSRLERAKLMGQGILRGLDCMFVPSGTIRCVRYCDKETGGELGKIIYGVAICAEGIRLAVYYDVIKNIL